MLLSLSLLLLKKSVLFFPFQFAFFPSFWGSDSRHLVLNLKKNVLVLLTYFMFPIPASPLDSEILTLFKMRRLDFHLQSLCFIWLRCLSTRGLPVGSSYKLFFFFFSILNFSWHTRAIRCQKREVFKDSFSVESVPASQRRCFSLSTSLLCFETRSVQLPRD